MNCRETQQQLSAHLDGELEAALATKVEAHLAECASCRQQQRELERLARGIAALPQVPVPPDFLAEVQRKLDPAMSGQGRSWLDELVPWWGRIRIPALATLAVLGCIVWLARAPHQRSPGNRQTATSSKPGGPQIVLEQPSREVAALSPPAVETAADIGPSSPVQSKGWVVAERLDLADHATDTANRLVEDRKAFEAQTTEPLGRRGVDASRAKITAGRLVLKPTVATLELVGADTALVQSAAAHVAGQLGGSTSKLTKSADGRLSFLHVEVPATQLRVFQQQFDRQFALLCAQNPREPLIRAPASAAAPSPLSLGGGTRFGLGQASPETLTTDGSKAAASGAEELRRASRGLVGLDQTNDATSATPTTPPSAPMVILEIQIRASQP